MSDYSAPAATAVGWPLQKWVEECERRDKKPKNFLPVTRQANPVRASVALLSAPLARYCIDTLGLTAGELMALAAGRTRRWSGTGTAFDTLGVFEGQFSANFVHEVVRSGQSGRASRGVVHSDPQHTL